LWLRINRLALNFCAGSFRRSESPGGARCDRKVLSSLWVRLVRSAKVTPSVLLGSLLFACPAWAWFAEGHEIVAVIAADDLTPTATSHLAQILGVPADAGSVERAMAAASIRPDTEFRVEDRTTARCHTSTSASRTTKQISRPRELHIAVSSGGSIEHVKLVDRSPLEKGELSFHDLPALTDWLLGH
jgi:hypothetical protein